MEDSVKQINNSSQKEKPWLWKPGESGNPHGRPPASWSWAECVREVMERVDPATKKEYKTAIAEALFKAAQTGDVQAIKEIGDRIDGKPSQKIDTDLNAHIVVTGLEFLQKR